MKDISRYSHALVAVFLVLSLSCVEVTATTVPDGQTGFASNSIVCNSFPILIKLRIMWHFLSAPYPFVRNRVVEFLVIIAIGVFIDVFLLIFEPFGTSQFQAPDRTLFLSGYGLIVSVVGLIGRFLVPSLFPAIFVEENWTVARQIVWVFALYVIATTACYGYWAWYFDNNTSMSGWLGFSLIAGSIGIFPICAVVTLDYIALLRKYQRRALIEGTNLATPEPVTTHWSLQGKGQEETLNLSPDEVCYIRAAGNYTEVMRHTDNGLEATLLRVTLQDIESQLAKQAEGQQLSICRCHRSYLVNLGKVTGIQGNAQGYRLQLAACAASVPVSRSRAEDVLAHLHRGRP